MTEIKKNTGLKIALIIVSALLVVSVIINIYFYTQQHGILSDSGLQNQITTLQNEIDQLKAPKLITRLGANDIRLLFSTPYMEISGTVWNVGKNTAQDCRIHVILYQGATVAKATYITLGSIDGEQWKGVTEKIYYEGSAITEWEMDIEYK